MSVVPPAVVRAGRTVTDWLVPYSFGRAGFRGNRLGFPGEAERASGDGKVALVTGANSGIGFAAARELARRGCTVWLLCRDAERGRAAAQAIQREVGEGRAQVAQLDMANLDAVRRFAASMPDLRIDILVHNAGSMAKDLRTTAEGLELTFAVHVVAPFVLTELLLPRLTRAQSARVIFVASGGLYLARLDLDLARGHRDPFDGVRAYANAKRAQVVLAHALARAHAENPHVRFASMHPGWVDTSALATSLPRFHALTRRLLRSPEQGSDTITWLALSGSEGRPNGAFWFDRRLAPEYPIPWTHESGGERDRLVALCSSFVASA